MTKNLTSSLKQKIAGLLPDKRKFDTVGFGPIGMEIGNNRVLLVQVQKVSGGISVSSSVSVPFSKGRESLLSAPVNLKKLLGPVLHKNGFRGTRVATCLHKSMVSTMMINYTMVAGKKQDELIAKRIADCSNCDLSELVIDYIPVRTEPRDGQEQSALVAYAKHDEIIGYLEYLRKSGFKVESLDVEAAAIRRLVSLRADDDNEVNLVVVSMGQSQTYVTILSGRRLIYDRESDFGKQQLLDMLCKELDMDKTSAQRLLDNEYVSDSHEEKDIELAPGYLLSVLKPMFMNLADDINKALIYAAAETRGRPVQKVLLTGVLTDIDGVEGLIKNLINVPIELLNPFEPFVNGTDYDPDTSFSEATGMSLHGLIEG